MAGSSNNNLAIIAIIAVGVLVVVGATLFFSGVIGGKDSEPDTKVVIEKQSQQQAPKQAEEPGGFTFKYEDGDGKKTELQTP